MKRLILTFLLCAPAFSQDWQSPAYWGLPKGSYIPTNENCMGGTFEPPYHNKHKEFDFETCASITYLQERNQ